MSIRCLLAAVGCCLLPEISASAHPQHSSLAEVEWNEKSGRFEVALRINSFQLEAELSASNPRELHAGPISLEHTAQIEEIVSRYVEQRFLIATDSHRKCRFHWVGMELERLDLWVYFELLPLSDTDPSIPVSLRKIRIHNSLLMSVHPQQVNLVNLIDGTSVRSSHHSVDAPEASPEAQLPTGILQPGGQSR